MSNTNLLKTYADLDPRVQVLGYAFKHFAKVCFSIIEDCKHVFYVIKNSNCISVALTMLGY